LNLRIKPKRRIKREKPKPLAVATKPNQIWSMDFIHDYSGTFFFGQVSKKVK